MNIVYIADDSFIPLVCVSLHSLLSHNENEMITFYIFSTTISHEKKSMISNLVLKYKNKKIVFVNISNVIPFCKGLNLPSWRGSYSMYARLFVDTYLPNERRALILDADTLIRKPLNKLWEWDLKGKTFGGVIEPFRYDYITNKSANLENFDGYYINTGVLLVDLDRMKKIDFIERVKTTISKNKIRVVDQDIINYGFQEEIAEIPLTYNFTSATFYLSYKDYKNFYYASWRISKEDYYGASRDPAVVHFDTSWDFHPWVKRTGVLFGNEWLSQYKQVFGKNYGFLSKIPDENKTRKIAYYVLPGFAKRNAKRLKTHLRLRQIRKVIKQKKI
jgi:lipopolysaccharide biosynthesis glycosyltransferase